MALAVKERSEPPVTLDLALKHGLTAEEFGRITGILGRNPTYTELGIYSVMWSEHCSYKNSSRSSRLSRGKGGGSWSAPAKRMRAWLT